MLDKHRITELATLLVEPTQAFLYTIRNIQIISAVRCEFLKALTTKVQSPRKWRHITEYLSAKFRRNLLPAHLQKVGNNVRLRGVMSSGIADVTAVMPC